MNSGGFSSPVSLVIWGGHNSEQNQSPPSLHCTERRRELPWISGRALTGTQGTPRLALHPTISPRPHMLSARVLQPGGGRQSESPCIKGGGTYLLPRGTRESREALLACLTLQRNKSRVSLGGPGRPLPLEKPNEP